MSENAESKLLAWLGAGTWHTSHDCDMDRWYAFVDQYQKDHGYTIDEPALREYIEGKVEGDVNEDLREIISNQIDLAYSILDFLQCTGR